MQWWNDIVDWFSSDSGQLVVYGAIIPFIAIVVAGLVAAAIGRGAVRRLVGQRDRETRASAVAALIAAGQTAARWHSQPPQTREHFEALAAAADVQVRLLPLNGAPLAADWAAHELADMRTNSISFSFQADQTLREYRDRLVEWLHRPSKAKRLFAADLERWRYDEPTKVDPVILEQQKWAEEQFAAESRSGSATNTTASAAAPAPNTTGPVTAAVAPTSTRNPAVERAATASATAAYERRANEATAATPAVARAAAAPTSAAPTASAPAQSTSVASTSAPTTSAPTRSTPPASAKPPTAKTASAKAAPTAGTKPTSKSAGSAAATQADTTPAESDTAAARR